LLIISKKKNIQTEKYQKEKQSYKDPIGQKQKQNKNFYFPLPPSSPTSLVILTSSPQSTSY
jgi:hypothetical protein